ncbi:uncharacterized protein C8Q71DRAFT_770391 [Rhodofomes roseus]|uniref:BTB domain-containing protein n=1 Tax=Rhodofomes roseus TaxID=34475 RepID=A0ABQ8KAK8_9APHY|nr:uncharacterized protein C8Q71DRAFT_770391 [Rhodofomes roseus]KAH9833975.1 hypothetical protein C8Q71DRAFT_770391 [Rhodofomes roseus]
MDIPTQAEDPAGFVHDEEIWFADGNVVLEAKGHVFRIYQGLLAHNSEIFRDLFTVPQPTSMETYEGCPIVHLTDRPEDLRHLLRVIYHGNRYYRPDEQLEFAAVAALVRLAHKYQIDHVRDAYLWRMKSCFCTELATWEIVTEGPGYGSPIMKFRLADAIAAVNIARLTGTESMLPSALYLCCRLGTERLLNGCSCPDGTLESLDPADVIKCIDARHILHQKYINTRFELYNPIRPSLQCLECRTKVEVIRQRIMCPRLTTMKFAVDLLLSPFCTRFDIRQTEGRIYICPECQSVLRMAEESLRKETWTELPQLLGIEVPPGWASE